MARRWQAGYGEPGTCQRYMVERQQTDNLRKRATVTEVQRVCAECGAPYPARPDGGGRCEACSPVKDRQPARAFTGGPRGRGYTARWDRLSRRARELQPFCLDCGTRDDLTADHTPEAWQRYEAGKSIRLQDIEVVCRPCNGRRGAARGEQLGAGRVRFDRSDQRRRADDGPAG